MDFVAYLLLSLASLDRACGRPRRAFLLVIRHHSFFGLGGHFGGIAGHRHVGNLGGCEVWVIRV